MNSLKTGLNATAFNKPRHAYTKPPRTSSRYAHERWDCHGIHAIDYRCITPKAYVLHHARDLKISAFGTSRQAGWNSQILTSMMLRKVLYIMPKNLFVDPWHSWQTVMELVLRRISVMRRTNSMLSAQERWIRILSCVRARVRWYQKVTLVRRIAWYN